jgi:hypothetical protein
MRSFFSLHVELGVAAEGGVGHEVVTTALLMVLVQPLPRTMLELKAYRRLPRLTMLCAL